MSAESDTEGSAPLEQRVTQMERNIDRIDENLNGLYSGIVPDLKETLSEIKAEQAEIRSMVESMQYDTAEVSDE